MDKEYILMCKGVTEIQKQWTPKEGDLTWNSEEIILLDNLTPTLLGKEWDELWDDSNPNIWWLPRQEDLQQIFKEEKQVSEDITLLLFKRYIADLGSVCAQCEGMSIIKAWLCCIMEKLYAKEWDSESKTWVSL